MQGMMLQDMVMDDVEDEDEGGCLESDSSDVHGGHGFVNVARLAGDHASLQERWLNRNISLQTMKSNKKTRILYLPDSDLQPWVDNHLQPWVGNRLPPPPLPLPPPLP